MSARSTKVYPGFRSCRYVVVEESTIPGGRRRWLCVCDCGTNRDVMQDHLLARCADNSCGCIQRERTAAARTTHGHSINRKPTPEYNTWQKLKSRCSDLTNPSWPDYGGRGISVCARWVNSFENFIADIGKRPSAGMTIERIDNNGDYTPLNCKWATPTEQGRNKRSNRIVSYNGETLPLSVWSERTGIGWNTLASRLANGWTDARVVTTPLLRQNGRATVKKAKTTKEKYHGT